MSKNKKQYACQSCGVVLTKWSGQCPECQSWGTIIEEVSQLSRVNIASQGGTVLPIEALDENYTCAARKQTPIEELNRVLGGGLVAGSAILLGGDPGIGKSTLMLQLATSLAEPDSDRAAIYITGEESAEQIKLRAKRLELVEDNTMLVAANNLEDILATIDKHKKKIQLVIIDSIQTIASNEISSAPGTISQIKHVSNKLISYTKQNELTLLMACHVNKDGQLAGPKIVEHMVDTVLYFEGDHNNHFRILRSIKNRFGGVNEIGVFEMTGSGLREIRNPSELFLLERENNVSGSAVFAAIEGSRPLLIEIQALISPSNMAMPRRSVVGWDQNRLSMIIAVLAVRYGLNLNNYEVYLSVAGGLKITDPAADLAVAAALISSASNIALPARSVFFGEIGLSGEVRRVSQGEARVKEAAKLGFEQMFCSNSSADDANNIHKVSHLMQLKSLLASEVTS